MAESAESRRPADHFSVCSHAVGQSRRHSAEPPSGRGAVCCRKTRPFVDTALVVDVAVRNKARECGVPRSARRRMWLQDILRHVGNVPLVSGSVLKSASSRKSTVWTGTPCWLAHSPSAASSSAWGDFLPGCGGCFLCVSGVYWPSPSTLAAESLPTPPPWPYRPPPSCHGLRSARLPLPILHWVSI